MSSLVLNEDMETSLVDLESEFLVMEFLSLKLSAFAAIDWSRLIGEELRLVAFSSRRCCLSRWRLALGSVIWYWADAYGDVELDEKNVDVLDADVVVVLSDDKET